MTEVRAGDSYRVELPDFEGPLDLLLHLCKTHEIDIVKLPIAFVTEKYLEYLDVMQTMSVDLAADYLVMAATLAYLKSRELVPAPEALEVADEEGGEEVLDPREELIRRLLEYQKYKNAAALLGKRPIEGRNIFGRGMEIEGDNAPTTLADHSVWKLIEAFGRLLEKAGPKVTHEVAFDRVSIGSRINQLIDKLELQRGALRFDELFDLSLSEPELRSQLVVTLLAILELARLKVVRVLASEQDETLIIAQVEGAQLKEARRAKVTSDGESIEVGELTDGLLPDESADTAVAAEIAAETVVDALAEPIEEPNAEEPNAEEPNAEEPSAEEPNAEEPNAEEPNAEEPNAEEPSAEEPNVEEPNAEEPNVEEPNAEEPNVEEPNVEEPNVEVAVAGEPAAPESVAEIAADAVASGPAQPVAEESVAAVEAEPGRAGESHQESHEET